MQYGAAESGHGDVDDLWALLGHNDQQRGAPGLDRAGDRAQPRVRGLGVRRLDRDLRGRLEVNHASVTTVGILTGIIFLAFGAEQFLLATIDHRGLWLWAIFGGLLTAAVVVALIHPVNTFAGLADILGFIFLLIGVLWMIPAFVQQEFNQLWWLQLISGILVAGMAFWVSGQFSVTRAATLLVSAGIWVMMKGVTDIVRAFQICEVGQTLSRISH